jgi:membrane-associated PAP2 superfamily phosphatase
MIGVMRKIGSVALRRPVWVPAAVLVVLTVVCWSTDVDRAMMRPFFSSAGGTTETRWPLGEVSPWKLLYNWGVYPAWALGCGGLAVWVLSFRWPKWERWRDPGLFFALLLIVGPGILVNGVLKPCWNRPRPYNVTQFGGPRPFRPVLQRGHDENDASFPSGHAAMGFCLMAPAFVCYRRRPGLAAAFLVLGLGWGGILGLARVVAGGHFPSDVLWSAGVVYFTGLALAAPFHFGDRG